MQALKLDRKSHSPDNAGWKPMMRQFKASVIFNQTVSQGWMLLGYSWPEDLDRPSPGQFFTFNPKGLQAGDAGLLRRPLAFAYFGRGLAFALYQVRGKATQALSVFSEGGSLDVIGPLGNSFPQPLAGEAAFLAGGGIGIGPLLYMHSSYNDGDKTLNSQNRVCGGAAIGATAIAETTPGAASAGRFSSSIASPVGKLYLGFRSASQIPSFSLAAKRWGKQGRSDGQGERPSPQDQDRVLEALANLQLCLDRATIATDDGSMGYKGTVVEALRADFDRPGTGATPRKARLYACGPAPMLSALDNLALENNIFAHLSAEQWMACGVGACQGCVLPARAGGYLRACADGPIFPQGAILWNA
jgi:NAD(P)H-flavin reductase